MTVQRLASATNRKSVPTKPIYFSGWRRPTSSICCTMPVTTISSRFCQRDRFSSVERLRVMNFEATASANISPQVNTIVPLSLRNPSCQKIISSGLRRTADLRRSGVVEFDRWAGQPLHDETRQDKAEETQQPSLPILAPDKI